MAPVCLKSCLNNWSPKEIMKLDLNLIQMPHFKEQRHLAPSLFHIVLINETN